MRKICIKIDQNKCVGCSKCVNDCVSSKIDLINGKANVSLPCIECGHCFAICPVGAVSMEGYDNLSNEIFPFTEFDSGKLLAAMKSRRTIRKFKDLPVEKEKIDMILEAGRYCPTASNSQNIAYTILGSRQDEIENACVKTFRLGVNFGKPFSKTLMRANIDDNFFFKKAPLVIVVSGSDKISASLASSYMEIMANSLGLGVLYSGFFTACAEINPQIKKMLCLPSGHKAVTCLVIGYPDVKYQRTVPRKPLNMKIL